MVSIYLTCRSAFRKKKWTANENESRLATLLIRSGSNIKNGIAVIKDDGCLGEFDQEIYEEELFLSPNLHDVTFDSHEREGKLLDNGQVEIHRNVLGFFLPHGLTTDPEISKQRLNICNQRYHDIESAWRRTQPSMDFAILELVDLQLEVPEDVNGVVQNRIASIEAGAKMEANPTEAISDGSTLHEV